jgi:hypothetical protein
LGLGACGFLLIIQGIGLILTGNFGLASLDRRSENVGVLPVVISELEGEREIIALSTNPRSMVQTIVALNRAAAAIAFECVDITLRT